jgi:hypothetical protein
MIFVIDRRGRQSRCESMSESDRQPNTKHLWAGAESLNKIVGCLVSAAFLAHPISLFQWLGPHLSASWREPSSVRLSKPNQTIGRRVE